MKKKTLKITKSKFERMCRSTPLRELILKNATDPAQITGGVGSYFSQKCALKALVFQRSFKRPSFAKTNTDSWSEFFLEQEIRAGRFVIIHTKTIIERRQADLGHVFEFDSNTCIDSSARCLRGLDGRTVHRMDAA